MNIRKSILTSLVLAVMGLFLAGCGCDGQCPFKKMFGATTTTTQCPPTATTPCPHTPPCPSQ